MADTKISALSDGTTPAGTDKFAIARSGANNSLTWTEMLAAMPGAEIGYDQITGSVTVSSTTEASGTTLISCAAHTFDGAAVMAEFYFPLAYGPVSLGYLILDLFEASTQIAEIAVIQNQGANAIGVPIYAAMRFTPTAGSHTYTVTAYKSGGSGTVLVSAGASGAGQVPGFARFTKV